MEAMTETGGCPGSLTEVGWHGCFVYSRNFLFSFNVRCVLDNLNINMFGFLIGQKVSAELAQV